MPRSIWNGTITFGMVNVPVKLYSATESKSIHFHEVHVRDGARIEHRRVCSKEDKEVSFKDVVKGYEVSSGRYVVLENDEVKAAAGDRGKVVHIEEFVEAADIDPVPTSSIPTGGKKASKRALGDALAIIEELSTEWDPESYTDCYRERLRKVIERKRKGRTIEVPDAQPEPKPVPDLMAALERTLENARAGRDLRDEDGDLEALSRKELGERAKEAGIRGRTKMSKDELVEALAGEE